MMETVKMFQRVNNLLIISLFKIFPSQTNWSTVISLALAATPPSLCPPCPHLISLQAHLRTKDP